MIVIGYQGIGKSTLAGKNNCIDLESGNFWVNGNRNHDWYKAYCQIAVHLHRQGFVVMTSSHEVVREYFKEIMTPEDRNATFVCYPDLWLKNAWVNKLEERYQTTQLDKDFKAWKNAEARFSDNINELMTSGFKSIVLETMRYNLEEEIIRAKERI